MQVQSLISRWGGAVDLDLIASPFDTLVRELEQFANTLINCARPSVKPQWSKRPFQILFTNSLRANACATKDDGTDYVIMTIGLIQEVYGTMLGLMSVPSSLPPIGVPPVEVPQIGEFERGFPPFPILTKEEMQSGKSIRVCRPTDVARLAFGMQLSLMALQFVVRHEVGHILAGHLELAKRHGISPEILEVDSSEAQAHLNPPRNVRECDADMFAIHWQSLVDLHPETTKYWHETYGWNDVPPQDGAFIAHATAIAILFRLFDMRRGDGYAPEHNIALKHPHPTLRSNMAISRSFGLAVDAQMFKMDELPRLIRASWIPVEELWLQLRLPGLRLGERSNWESNIKRLSEELDIEYRRHEPILNEISRVYPRWRKSWPHV